MPKFKVGDKVYVDGYTTPNARNKRVHVKGNGTVKEVDFIYAIVMDKPFVDEFGLTRTLFAAAERELSPLKVTNQKANKLVFTLKTAQSIASCSVLKVWCLIHRQHAVLMILLASSQAYRLHCNAC